MGEEGGQRPHRYVPDDAWRPSAQRRNAETGPGAPESGPESNQEAQAAYSSIGEFYSRSMAEYGSWPAVLGLLLLSILAANVFGVALSAPALLGGEDPLSSSFTLALLLLLQAVVFVGAIYLFLIRRGVTTWESMGFGRDGRGSPVLRGAGWGLLFIVVASTVGALQSVLFGLEQEEALPFDIEGMGTAGKAALLFGGVVLAPISEEIFFRGFIFRAITARKGLLRGVLYSSFLFGAIHLVRDWPPDVSPLLPIAAGSTLLALAYHRTRSIWTPIVAHAVNNAFAFGVLFLAV